MEDRRLVRFFGRLLAPVLLLVAAGDFAAAQAVDPELLAASAARPLGPAAPGGRFVDVDVPAQRPWELWAASASGGVWKSANNGTTWECVFADALSIGDLAVAPSDPDVVWIGTGEGNNQRSSYAGNGVWRSTDGGKSFAHVGLADSHHIGRVVVHPADPATAWVAVLGHLYSANEERGLWKTSDGGATWEQVLGRGEQVGVADVVVDPRDPEVLFASTYQRLRRAWHFDDVGDAALYQSTDGGESWRKVEGGLPSGRIGRIGVTCFTPDPSLLYACIDNQNLVDVPPEKEGDKPAQRPIGGEVWRSTDGGATWEKRNDKPVSGEPPYYYGQIRVDPHDRDHVWLLGIQVFVSHDGGKTFASDVANSLHSDHHALWFDPAAKGRLLLGNDGGLAQSYDDGKSFDYYLNLSVAQFYTVSVDPRRPYRVYGGLQDNGVWMGPSRSRGFGGTSSNEWRFIGGGDGMYVLADPDDPDTVYLESQFGALQRTNTRTADTAFIQPRGAEGERDRFNWCSPLVVSSHNSRVLYFGSQRLWKSLDRGTRWKPASGDLTSNDAEKLKGNVPHCTLTTISESPLDPDLLLVGSDDGKVQWTEDGGKSWSDLSDRFPELPPALWVSRVELSHFDKAVAWVAFNGYREDDFTPWVYRTRDGGKSFERVTAGLPAGPVNVVRESPRRAKLLFVGSDGGAHFSVDGGDHWQPLTKGVPLVSVLDLVVHPREREVVLGTHGRGLFVVDVTAHEQIDAKVLDATAHLFEPATATAWRASFGGGAGGTPWAGDRHFRAPSPDAGAPIWLWLGGDPAANPTMSDDPTASSPGERVAAKGAADEKDAAAKDDGAAKKAGKVEIVDAAGKVVRTIEIARQPGLQRVLWDLQLDPPPQPAADGAKDAPKEEPKEPPPDKRKRRRYEPLPEENETSPGEVLEDADAFDAAPAQDATPPRRRGRGGRGGSNAAPPGRYTVRLVVGETTVEKTIELAADPGS